MQDARATTFELFGDDNLRAMIHHAGPATEIAAAQSICKRRNRLQELVLQAFHDLGDMTDEQLERLSGSTRRSRARLPCRCATPAS